MQSLSTHQQLFKQRRFRLMFVVFLMLSLLIGIVVVPIERSTGNIVNVSDGLWWAVQTVTTVGYGDRVPVTDLGRMLGVVLQIVGALMFGVMIAIISHFFSRVQDEFYWNRLFERLDRIEGEIEELRKRTGYIVKSNEKSMPIASVATVPTPNPLHSARGVLPSQEQVKRVLEIGKKTRPRMALLQRPHLKTFSPFRPFPPQSQAPNRFALRKTLTSDFIASLEI